MTTFIARGCCQSLALVAATIQAEGRKRAGDSEILKPILLRGQKSWEEICLSSVSKDNTQIDFADGYCCLRQTSFMWIWLPAPQKMGLLA